jgi:hypothetical protein
MNAKVRRRLDMAGGALNFSRNYPDPNPRYIAMVTTLEALLRRADELILQERDGAALVTTAARRKRELRRTMKSVHLPYVARVGMAAAAEVPDLKEQLWLKRGSRAYLVFRTGVKAIVQEGMSQKEVLERHGLVGPVFEELARLLAEFDQACEDLIEGRRLHVGARAGLQQIAHELVRQVSLIDGFNRFRFAAEPGILAGWIAVSKVLKHSRHNPPESAGESAPAGDARPAA